MRVKFMYLMSQVLCVTLLLVLTFGCVEPPKPPPILPPLQNLTLQNLTIKNCTNVTDSIPTTVQECSNSTSLNESCAYKKLEYKMSAIAKTHICTDLDLCGGYDIKGKCTTWYCSKGTTLCQLNLTNNDRQYVGTWVLSGNFTLNGKKFDKNPVSLTLNPGETKQATFQQFYEMDMEQLLTNCAIYVSQSPTVRHCFNTSITTESCRNTTTYKTVTTEVCR